MRMVILTLCLLPLALAEAEELQRFDLNDPEAIPLKILKCEESPDDTGAISIHTPSQTSVAIAEFEGPTSDNIKLICEAEAMTMMDANVFVYLELWCKVDGQWYFGRGLDSGGLRGTNREWTGMSTSFLLQKDQRAEKIVINLVMTGSGTVRIDDLVLKTMPLE